MYELIDGDYFIEIGRNLGTVFLVSNPIEGTLCVVEKTGPTSSLLDSCKGWTIRSDICVHADN